MPAKRLPWIKFWPEMLDHEKFAELSDSESWTWVNVWGKASQQPVRWRFASAQHAAKVSGRPIEQVRRLIDARLLDERQDGLWIHDWQQWQNHYPSDYEDSANTPPTPGHHSANDTATLPEASANASATLPEASVNGAVITASSASHRRARAKTGEERRENIETPNGVLSASADVPPGDDRVDEVYEHFKARIQPRSRTCPKKKIAARLKRFTVTELREGIDHFAEDPWWMEHNAIRGAEWFFESDSRSEQFLLLERPMPTPINRNGQYRSPPERPAPPREYIDVSGFQGLNIKGRGETA